MLDVLITAIVTAIALVPIAIGVVVIISVVSNREDDGDE